MELADLPNPGLTEKLLRDHSSVAPDVPASSHWRQMHRETVACVEEVSGPKGRLKLSGRGFGNVQNCHPAQMPLEWMTSIGHCLLSKGQLDLVGAVGVLRRLFRRIRADCRLKITFDAVRQAFVWQTIRPLLVQRRPLTWCVIGDGFGVFSALIKEFQPDARIYLIDLPKTLVFQTVYVQMMHPRASHSLLEEGRDTDFVYCPAPQMPDSRGGIDVFVNVASMQEMTLDSIARYFDLIRRTGVDDHRFYCCNRVEKKLAGGEVIRFSDYLWSKKDEIYLDGPCPFQRFFLHLRTLPTGPKVLGFRVPFVNYYDGTIWHRLARLGAR